MFYVVYSLFCIVRFPHEGKIVTVDRLSFFSSSSSNGNVPYVGNTRIPYVSVGAGLFKVSNLIGKFVRIPYGREPLPPEDSKVFYDWLRGGEPMDFQHETDMMQVVAPS